MKKSANIYLFQIKPNSGSILVMAIWLITVMAIFGVGLGRISWSAYKFAKLRSDRFRSLYAIHTIVAMSKLNRLSDETGSYDTLPEFPEDVEYKSGNLKIIYSFIDEERKININNTPRSILENLPGMDRDKANAITNSELKPFNIKEKLLMLDEIAEEDYLNMKDFITVHGDGPLNINTCSEEMLEIIGMDRNLIATMTNFRKGEDGEFATEDDRFFESSANIIDSLREELYLSLRDEQTLISLISKNMLGVKANNYRIEADVYASGKLIDKYLIIFGKIGDINKYLIREWVRH